MLLLQALPTSIGVAAIAPALLVLWLVIAADERPGPPTRVWLAFILGAASIIAGSLWDITGPQGTFLAGAGFALVALAGLLMVDGKIGKRTGHLNPTPD